MENNVQATWGFIVNPIAGTGASLIVEQELLKQIEKRGINAKLKHTEKAGHAKDVAKEFAEEGCDYVIAVGGDGTFNEMASIMVNYPKCTIGILPAGTGNDFAKIIGLTEKFSAQDWDVFFEAKTNRLDVGRCNGNLFFNGMGLGFDAQVASENYVTPDEVKERSKNLYIWYIVKNLLFYKERHTKANSNGESREDLVFMNTISIGRRFAGGFYITPKAIADDGLLDVCVVGRLNFFQRLNILLQVPKGTHLSHKKVSYYQSNKLTMEVEKESAYHLDGELFFDSKFEIDIMPEKLNIIYNYSGDHYFKNKLN